MLRNVFHSVRRQWAGFLALGLVIAGGGAYAAFDPVGSDGDLDACFAKRSGDLDLLKGKKCGRKERPVTWSVSGPEGPPGAAGEAGAPGTPGAPGKDAAIAFGYIADQAASTAQVNYGKGVTSVDEAGSFYTVNFDRGINGCVLTITSGFGNPSTSPGVGSVAETMALITSNTTARVELEDDTGTPIDSSFMIAALC